MTAFTAGWLALREAEDARARNRRVLSHLIAWTERAASHPITIVDLGAGTGAQLRFLARRLPVPQRWYLVDGDRALLERAASERHPHVRVQVHDLARGLPELPPGGPRLVTASALFDLVSAEWLAAFIQWCRDAGSAVYVSLTYDGTQHWLPALADDSRVRALVNRHQESNKGFGPALGPRAGAALVQCLDHAGFRVAAGASPWRVPPAAAALQRRLAGDWAAVASAGVMTAPWARRWLRRRLSLIDAGKSRLLVGHLDVFGAP